MSLELLNTINFQLESRAAVDGTYQRAISTGYCRHLTPFDPLWQSRFAILPDPNGNFIRLHSPRRAEANRERE